MKYHFIKLKFIYEMVVNGRLMKIRFIYFFSREEDKTSLNNSLFYAQSIISYRLHI